LNPTAPKHPTVPFLHPLPASLPLQHSDNANRVWPTVTGFYFNTRKCRCGSVKHRPPADDERESGCTG
jgi:hypothetical protein